MNLPFPRFNRRYLALAHDTVMSAVSFLLALYLRLGLDIEKIPTDILLISTGVFTLTCSIVFFFSGLYKGVWGFASVRDLVQIVRASSLAIAVYALAGFLFTRLEGVPRTVPFIAWFILLAGLGGSRLLFRILRERRLSALWEKSGGGRTNILILGAGEEADLFIRAFNNNPQSPFKVVGVIGENEKRVGRRIHGVEVLGTVKDLPAIFEKLKNKGTPPCRLVLTRAQARMNSVLVEELLEKCSALGIGLSSLPSLIELKNDVGTIGEMQDRPLALEDLLGRPETVLNRQAIKELIKDKRVIVTGAGGSIGSELVRQIAVFCPARLVLLDSSEYHLYKIEMEARETFPKLNLGTFIADVRDLARITQIFRDEKPDLVFHAAAIKHVPLAEANVREAILTNVIGTKIVADCAEKFDAKAMVLISTDKAVRPANVMGATKRLAEMYCQALDLASNGTRFLTVRFGNVLGSTGSVVPRFQEQLEKGGPITVTHPEITRYFMTTREAVELVLQASVLGMRPEDQRGKVLVLDMGQPVKIVDLARQMIRLAGLKPDSDIAIVYTGLRPGEKLHEELFSPNEEIMPSSADGVRIAKSPTVELGQIQQSLSQFAALLQAGMPESAAQARLAELVPEFRRG